MRRGGRMPGRGRGQPGRAIEPLMNVRKYRSPEIQSINMELELLKQKREMIEQQQNMLKTQIMYNQQRQYQSENSRYFEQVPYDSPGPSRSVQNFARYYDDPVEQDYIPLTPGRKRQADTDWPRGPSPKRFGSRRGSVVQAFGPRLGPKPVPQFQNSEPNVQFEGHTRRPVMKPRERAKPVSTSHAVIPDIPLGSSRPFNENPEKYTLRADKEPSTALNGLIELTVGHILKRIQQKFGHISKFNRYVSRPYYTRRIKKALRYRIKDIIMDKCFTDYLVIYSLYRKKFSEKTDLKLVKAVMQGEVYETPAKCIPDAPCSGMPCPRYYKRKMRHFIGSKLRKMFTDIHEMYNSPNDDKEWASVLNVGSTANKEKSGNTASVTSQEGGKRQPKKTKWKVKIAEILDEKVASMVHRYLAPITEILNMDPEYKTTKAQLLAEALKMDPTITGEVVIGDLEGLNIKDAVNEPTMPMHYYAKVQGVPNLPPRNLMRPFLDKFFPSATKLHKIMKNLLYVTFCDKDNFDKFLAQDGVTIGGIELKIQVSGKAKPILVKNDEIVNLDVETDSQRSTNSNDDIISSSLNNTIDDLLSSIRMDEEAAINNEEKAENINNDNVPTSQDVDNVSTSQHVDNVPTLENAENVPTSGNVENVPPQDKAENVPTSENAETVPISENAETMLTSGNEENVPTSENAETVPISENAETMPTSGNEENMPTSENAEKVSTSQDGGKDEEPTKCSYISMEQNGGDKDNVQKDNIAHNNTQSINEVNNKITEKNNEGPETDSAANPAGNE